MLASSLRLTLLVCVLIATGCSSLSLKKPAFTVATVKNPAVRCLCLWQQAEGPGLRGENCRGFAAQVFFFTQGNEVPVVVSGDVRVYLFDDVGSEAEQAKPIHQVDLTQAEWNNRVTDSQFGPAYNVFIPYVRPGSTEANCALRVRLTRPDGSFLFSELTQVRLTGSPRREAPTPPQSADDVASVRDQRDAPAIRSTTIATQRDGESFRLSTNNRIRHIGEAPAAPLSADEERDERIRELEERLMKMQKRGSRQ